MADATTATAAIKAKIIKNPVAEFPIWKKIGEKQLGTSNPAPENETYCTTLHYH